MFFGVMDSLNVKLEKYFDKYGVSGCDSTSKEYFSASIKIATSEYSLPILEIAKKFQVADSTVERWASGVAIPHPQIRRLVLEWIVEQI